MVTAKKPDKTPLSGCRVAVVGVMTQEAEDAVRSALKRLGAVGVDVADTKENGHKILDFMRVGPIECRGRERKSQKRPKRKP